jgi:Lon protease-like protein
MIGTELPLFPLPVVLFPGTVQLLHIFEPRYRQMLRDCLEEDSRFGLSVRRPDKSETSTPVEGDVGCRAVIRSHHPLPDGRANILTVGEERYVIQEIVDRDRPYYVALVDYFHDDPIADSAVQHLTQDVRAAFSKIVSADSTGTGRAVAEQLPTDPVALSFHVAAALHIALEVKEELLRLTSTPMRLERLRTLLISLNAETDRRAQTQRLAKGNGRASQSPTTTSAE